MTTARSGDITPTIDEAQASERGNLGKLYEVVLDISEFNYLFDMLY